MVHVCRSTRHGVDPQPKYLVPDSLPINIPVFCIVSVTITAIYQSGSKYEPPLYSLNTTKSELHVDPGQKHLREHTTCDDLHSQFAIKPGRQEYA